MIDIAKLLIGWKTRSLSAGLSTGVLIACLVAVPASYLGWLKFVHDPKVARRAVEKIERKSDAQVQKSVQAQRALPVDGAARRLQSKYCADC